MKKMFVFMIAFAAQTAFSQIEKKPEDMIQPDYVLPCSTQTVGADGLCTLKISSVRRYASALYLHPKCDTGKFIYVNSANAPAVTPLYPQKLVPGEWVGVITGIIDTTGTGICIDSLWWNRKR